MSISLTHSQLSFFVESTLQHYISLSVSIHQTSIQSFIGSHLLLQKSACWLSTLCMLSTWPCYLSGSKLFAKPLSEFVWFSPFTFSLFFFNSYLRRCLIELNPTNTKAIPLKEMNVTSGITNIVVVPHSTKADFIDSIYEIVEILQKICSKMNSYFGKKVREINFLN